MSQSKVGSCMGVHQAKPSRRLDLNRLSRLFEILHALLTPKTLKNKPTIDNPQVKT
ncbi:MAG: hypothetical protein AAGJ83_07550 [Planctomycetota bacterium]